MTLLNRTGDMIVMLLALTSISVRTIAGQPPDQKIDIEEAGKLAYEIGRIHNPGASLTNSPRTFDPNFYFLAATWPNPNGSPIVGYFAVNPWTGDVWNAAGCEHLTSRSLEKLQQDIRGRFRFKPKEYAKLRAKRPRCGTE